MKPGRWIFLSGLIVCMGLTVWQRDNLKTIWGEYRALHKSYCYNKENYLVPRVPAIKEKIAKTDSEAAVMVNYLLNSTSRADEQTLNILSENIFKYPDNQYFIYELAICTYLHSNKGLAPDVLVKLSDRLLELDSKNSNYYYIKAFALLHEREGNNFDKVVEAIKQAKKCEYYKDPYSIYIDRIISIAKRQGLPTNLIEQLDSIFPYNFFVGKIYNNLIQYQNLLITEGDFNKADEISNVLKIMISDKMREPFKNNNPLFDSFRLYGLGSGFGRWDLPQEVELQRKNLTQQEADQKRLEICAMVNPEKKVTSINRYYEPSEKNQLYAIAVLPFIYLVRTASVFIILTAILLCGSFLRKNTLQIKINKAGVILFLIYGFIYFVSGQFLMIAELFDVHRLGHCHISYMEVFFFPPFLSHVGWREIKDLFDAPLWLLSIFTFPFIIVFCMAVLRFFKPKFDNLITRFISSIMISMILGVAAMAFQGHTYIKYLPIIIFALFAFKYSFRKITLRDIFKAFGGSCKNDIPILRTELFKLSAIAAVLCWLGFVLLAFPVKKSMEMEEKEVRHYKYLFTDDYEKAYQNILKKIDNVNWLRSSVLRCIPLIKSNDLPGIMEKLKERKFPSYWAKGPYFSPPAGRDDSRLTDRSISFLLRLAGRDQMPVILSYMDNPDDDLTLVFRAQLGDKSVKDKLKNLLNDAIKEEGDPNKILQRENAYKPRESQIISALSVISEPDEAYALFKEYYERLSTQDTDLRFGYENICTLPKGTVLKIQNLYLDDFEKPDNDMEYFSLSLLSGVSEGLYLDEKIATRLLKLVLNASHPNGQISRLGIEYYLTSDASDMLIEGLENNDGDIRAWCVWQLRKINYKWSEEALKKIAEDKSWKVRANLTVIDKSLIKEDEANTFVKLIKSL